MTQIGWDSEEENDTTSAFTAYNSAYNSNANRNWQESADSEYDGVPTGAQVVPSLLQIEDTRLPVEELLNRRVDEERQLPSPQIIPGSTDIRTKGALIPSRRGKRAINQGLKDLKSRIPKRTTEITTLPTASEVQESSERLPGSSSVHSELTPLAVGVANV